MSELITEKTLHLIKCLSFILNISKKEIVFYEIKNPTDSSNDALRIIIGSFTIQIPFVDYLSMSEKEFCKIIANHYIEYYVNRFFKLEDILNGN